jgi:hypothetical protein
MGPEGWGAPSAPVASFSSLDGVGIIAALRELIHPLPDNSMGRWVRLQAIAARLLEGSVLQSVVGVRIDDVWV